MSNESQAINTSTTNYGIGNHKESLPKANLLKRAYQLLKNTSQQASEFLENETREQNLARKAILNDPEILKCVKKALEAMKREIFYYNLEDLNVRRKPIDDEMARLYNERTKVYDRQFDDEETKRKRQAEIDTLTNQIIAFFPALDECKAHKNKKLQVDYVSLHRHIKCLSKFRQENLDFDYLVALLGDIEYFNYHVKENYDYRNYNFIQAVNSHSYQDRALIYRNIIFHFIMSHQFSLRDLQKITMIPKGVFSGSEFNYIIDFSGCDVAGLTFENSFLQFLDFSHAIHVDQIVFKNCELNPQTFVQLLCNDDFKIKDFEKNNKKYQIPENSLDYMYRMYSFISAAQSCSIGTKEVFVTSAKFSVFTTAFKKGEYDNFDPQKIKFKLNFNQTEFFRAFAAEYEQLQLAKSNVSDRNAVPVISQTNSTAEYHIIQDAAVADQPLQSQVSVTPASDDTIFINELDAEIDDALTELGQLGQKDDILCDIYRRSKNKERDNDDKKITDINSLVAAVRLTVLEPECTPTCNFNFTDNEIAYLYNHKKPIAVTTESASDDLRSSQGSTPPDSDGDIEAPLTRQVAESNLSAGLDESTDQMNTNLQEAETAGSSDATLLSSHTVSEESLTDEEANDEGRIINNQQEDATANTISNSLTENQTVNHSVNDFAINNQLDAEMFIESNQLTDTVNTVLSNDLGSNIEDESWIGDEAMLNNHQDAHSDSVEEIAASMNTTEQTSRQATADPEVIEQQDVAGLQPTSATADTHSPVAAVIFEQAQVETPNEASQASSVAFAIIQPNQTVAVDSPTASLDSLATATTQSNAGETNQNMSESNNHAQSSQPPLPVTTHNWHYQDLVSVGLYAAPKEDDRDRVILHVGQKTLAAFEAFSAASGNHLAIDYKNLHAKLTEYRMAVTQPWELACLQGDIALAKYCFAQCAKTQLYYYKTTPDAFRVNLKRLGQHESMFDAQLNELLPEPAATQAEQPQPTSAPTTAESPTVPTDYQQLKDELITAVEEAIATYTKSARFHGGNQTRMAGLQAMQNILAHKNNAAITHKDFYQGLLITVFDQYEINKFDHQNNGWGTFFKIKTESRLVKALRPIIDDNLTFSKNRADKRAGYRSLAAFTEPPRLNLTV